MKTIQAIKHLSIRAYLAEQGLHPTKDNPRYGLYLSPLREEHMPSSRWTTSEISGMTSDWAKAVPLSTL